MERKRGRLFVLFLFLLLSFSLFSEFIKIYGLPRCRIRGLAQDGLGFIWVLTDKGIFIGEGRIFRPLPQLQQKIKGKVICMSPSKRGMWLATNKEELALWNWSEFKIYRWTRGPVLEMKEEKDGLLICSREGVFKWKADEGEKPIISAPVKKCWRNELLWVKLKDKFFRCSSSGCNQEQLPKELASFQAFCPLPEAFAVLDGFGKLWLKGKNSIKQLVSFPFKNPAFLKYAMGKFWIGDEGGLWVFRPEERSLHILFSKRPLFLQQDWEGNLWLSTERDLYLNPTIPRTYLLPSSPVVLFNNKNGKNLALTPDGRLFELRERPLVVQKLDVEGRIKGAAYCNNRLILKIGKKFYIWQKKKPLRS